MAKLKPWKLQNWQQDGGIQFGVMAAEGLEDDRQPGPGDVCFSLSTEDIWASLFLAVGDCPLCYGMLSSVPGLVSRLSLPVVTTSKSVSRHCQMSLGGREAKSPPAGNHWRGEWNSSEMKRCGDLIDLHGSSLIARSILMEDKNLSPLCRFTLRCLSVCPPLTRHAALVKADSSSNSPLFHI